MSNFTPHIDLGVVVRDIDASLAFYRDAVGLEVTGDTKLPGRSHMWMLKCGSCTLKLVTYDQTPEPANPAGGPRGGTGIRYWTLHVDDIEARVGACERAGAPIPLPVTEFVPGTRIAMVEDPDGNWLEFLQVGA